jgi:hypothetical protein
MIRFVLFSLVWVATFSFKFSFGQNHSDFMLDKLSISLTGKMPSKSEKDYFNLQTNEKKKFTIIDSLMNKKEFYIYIESKFRDEYLQSSSLDYLHAEAKDYYFLQTTRNGSTMQYQFAQKFKALHYLGKISLGKFKITDVSIKEIKKNLFSSPIYSSINMGSFNIVSSIFQHILNRKPTKAELNESINLIEGSYGVLFNNNGSSKEDFLNIVLEDSEYKENQIKYWYGYFFNEIIAEQDLIETLLKDYASTEELIKHLAIRLWDEN